MGMWWDGHPEQRYWMEHVSREGHGVELFAPRSGQWAHELVRHVQPGDVILHWQGGRGFVGTSVAAAPVGVEPRMWAGSRQDCWVVDLAEYEELDDTVSLAEVRAVEPQLKRAREVLSEAYSDFKYFPFDFSNKRELRAHQGYLTKFPLELFEILALAGLDAPVLFDPRTGQSDRRSLLAPAGPRYLTDTKLRLGVERHSVAVARRWYESRGATHVMELGKPYDLEVTLDRHVRHVEVKGSTIPRVQTVLLTRNEVAHARAFARADLVVVDGIRFETDDAGEYRLSGGELRRWADWVPSEHHLSGLQYEYSLQPAG